LVAQPKKAKNTRKKRGQEMKKRIFSQAKSDSTKGSDKGGRCMKKNLFVFVAMTMLMMVMMVGCGKPTIAEYISSDEIVNQVNESNASSSAEGCEYYLKYTVEDESVLVVSFIFYEYQSSDWVAELQNQGIDFEGLGFRPDALNEDIEDATGESLSLIRAQFLNSDGSLIYAKNYIPN
jgi:hypothetical protein